MKESQHIQSLKISETKLDAINVEKYLIEDCAQSHFAEFEGQFVGTFGDAATFSFYPGKNLGAYGDAGAVTTNNDALAEKVRMYMSHGALKKHHHLMEGINSRLDTIQAAVLLQKLPHIHEWNAARARVAQAYNSKLAGVGDIETQPIRANAKYIYHVYSIRTKKRYELQTFLNQHDIATAVHYPVALPLMPAYKHLNYTEADVPRAAKYQHEILSLPMYPEMTTEMIDYVVDTIKLFFKA